MLKEKIGIYQDPTNNKTTIVIYNMSKKTREQIATLLLGDLKTVETVSGLTEVPHEDAYMNPDITGMEPVVLQQQAAPAVEMPPVAQSIHEEADTPTVEDTSVPMTEQTSAPTREDMIPQAETKEEAPVEKKAKRGRPRKNQTVEAPTAKAQETAENVPTPVDFSTAINPPVVEEPETLTQDTAQADPMETESSAQEVPVETPSVETVETNIPETVVPSAASVDPEPQIPNFDIETTGVQEENAVIDQYAEMPEDMIAHDTESTPEEPSYQTNVYEDPVPSKASETVKALWQSYNENTPAVLLNDFLYFWNNGNQEEKVTAATEAAKLLELVAENRRKIQSLFWEMQACAPFTKALMSAIRQKGYGDGLAVESQEYMGAIVSTLNILSDEELVVLAKGAGKNLMEVLDPMFTIN